MNQAPSLPVLRRLARRHRPRVGANVSTPYLLSFELTSPSRGGRSRSPGRPSSEPGLVEVGPEQCLKVKKQVEEHTEQHKVGLIKV